MKLDTNGVYVIENKFNQSVLQKKNTKNVKINVHSESVYTVSYHVSSNIH